MAPSKQIGQLLRMLAFSEGSAHQMRQARSALRAEQRARALARKAKWAVGDERILVKGQAGRAAQRAAALSAPVLRPTMLRLQVEQQMVVESESERRYEVDQIMASARLEGAESTDGMQRLMDRYVRGEITRAEFGRLADEYCANVDYAALARASSDNASPDAGADTAAAPR